MGLFDPYENKIDLPSIQLPTKPYFQATNIPNACRSCLNHPSNGGSGICHCVLGSEITC